jgi:lipopolysaccharide/colanic/teichoic acid biosynthesis glycosyltransferase
MIKFRTMRVDAEKDGPRWARPCDPRVTPIGHFLRRTHLDELPQLYNVLRGEMSLVGPRPERPVFAAALSREIPDYARRHDVKPGITGLAQIHHHADQSLADVRVKLAYDLRYLEQRGFLLDLWILGETAWSIGSGRTLAEPQPTAALVEKMA